MPTADDIEVFYGRVTKNAAEVYARVTGLAGGQEWSLSGQVRGPFCEGVRTLPLTAAVKDLGAGTTLLAGCSIPDPATWSMLSPSYYKVTTELKENNETVAIAERSLGLRTLGGDGCDLRWEGKRWVLRGICVAEASVGELAQWREHNAVPIVSNPSDAILAATSASGVLLAVEVGVDTDAQEMRRLARQSAVGIVIASGITPDMPTLKATAPNVIFAHVARGSSPTELGSWADMLLIEADDTSTLQQTLPGGPLPVAAVRRLQSPSSFIAARAECDRLQRDLAAIGDFAGYIV